MPCSPSGESNGSTRTRKVTPSLAGSSNGAAYFATLENTGDKPDRLLRASTPAAASVELHNMGMDPQGVMRMREVDAIALAPKASIRMRPGMGFHLMLIGLRQPLKEGATFPMTLTFERAGKAEVKVVVQSPRADAPSRHAHALTNACAAAAYFARARSASLMPADTSTSAGSVFKVAAASRSL